MKVEHKDIVIHIEEGEVADLWNIIKFALDYDNANENAMVDSERKLAEELAERLERIMQ